MPLRRVVLCIMKSTGPLGVAVEGALQTCGQGGGGEAGRVEPGAAAGGIVEVDGVEDREGGGGGREGGVGGWEDAGAGGGGDRARRHGFVRDG